MDPYSNIPSAANTPTSTAAFDMVAYYPPTTSGHLKLLAHAEYYPNFTTILQEFLQRWNTSNTYVPSYVPPGLIDPNDDTGVPVQGTGGVQQQQQFIQQQQQFIQQQVPQVTGGLPPQTGGGMPQTLGTQQQQQTPPQTQGASNNMMNILKLVGLGAVGYLIYKTVK